MIAYGFAWIIQEQKARYTDKSSTLHHTYSDYYSEYVWCKVWINDQTSLLIGVIYRPPDSKSLDETPMLKLLHNATQHKSTFKLIVGDFNYPEIDWANFRYNSSCDNFMNTILDLCLVQHVLEPTRENHILD